MIHIHGLLPKRDAIAAQASSPSHLVALSNAGRQPRLEAEAKRKL
jgi:hypothetical protein